jgi:CheY-like chemotaxis protein
MGGLELARELRARFPRAATSLVAVTADAFEDTRRSCAASGFDGWLPKPFRVEEMTRVVAEAGRRTWLLRRQARAAREGGASGEGGV